MADVNKLNGFGNIGSAALNVGLGLYSLHQQKKENEKTREYNLKLAQMQNQWNVEQWQRQNDFNMPVNQVARLKAAGLNPDLLYGGGVSNTSSISPEMTAGAAGSPMDWSSLAGINPVDKVLQQELMRANINKIKSETVGRDIENNIRDFEREIVDVMREESYQGTFAYARAALEEYTAKLSKQNFQTESVKFNYVERQLQQEQSIREFELSLNDKRKEQFESLVRSAVANANIVEFIDQMKKLDFWTDKGISAAETVVGAIGALKGFSVPTKSEVSTLIK